MPRPFVSGNRVTLLVDGARTFDLALDLISAARRRVWLEAYIFEPDAAGLQMIDALSEASRRGVDVILLVDRFGSMPLRDRHLQPLRDAGGVAVWFNPPLGITPHGRKVTPFGIHRDHRKILIIDDEIGMTGGRNVSMDYRSTGEDGFRDVMVRIDGPAVRDLAAVFLETLHDTATHRRDLFAATPPAGDADVRVLQLDLREKVGDLDQAAEAMVGRADKQVLLCTPYFIPTRSLLNELPAAADRGVDVRVLTAGRSDAPHVTVAGRYLYRQLELAGVRIFEMTSHMLHAKFVVADGRRSILGSYNFDRWGRRFNQEVAVEVISEDLAAGLSTVFARGAQKEMRAGSIGLVRRAGHALAYGISQIVAPGGTGRRGK